MIIAEISPRSSPRHQVLNSAAEPDFSFTLPIKNSRIVVAAQDVSVCARFASASLACSSPGSCGTCGQPRNLSDTRVYEPQIRALLGTTAQFCKVVIRHLRYHHQPRNPKPLPNHSVSPPTPKPHYRRQDLRHPGPPRLPRQPRDLRAVPRRRRARLAGVFLFFFITLEPRVE